MPSVSDVERIVLTTPATETTIRDPTVIERFLAFLRARNSGWRKPPDTLSDAIMDHPRG